MEVEVVQREEEMEQDHPDLNGLYCARMPGKCKTLKSYTIKNVYVCVYVVISLSWKNGNEFSLNMVVRFKEGEQTNLLVFH